MDLCQTENRHVQSVSPAALLKVLREAGGQTAVAAAADIYVNIGKQL